MAVFVFGLEIVTGQKLRPSLIRFFPFNLLSFSSEHGNFHASVYQHYTTQLMPAHCGLEPRLKMRQFAIRAESRRVSKGLKVYDRENLRVSRSARPGDFYLSSTRPLLRDAREFSAMSRIAL